MHLSRFSSLSAILLVVIISHAALALDANKASLSNMGSSGAAKDRGNDDKKRTSGAYMPVGAFPRNQRPPAQADMSMDWKADKKEGSPRYSGGMPPNTVRYPDRSADHGPSRSDVASWKKSKRSLVKRFEYQPPARRQQDKASSVNASSSSHTWESSVSSKPDSYQATSKDNQALDNKKFVHLYGSKADPAHLAYTLTSSWKSRRRSLNDDDGIIGLGNWRKMRRSLPVNEKGKRDQPLPAVHLKQVHSTASQRVVRIASLNKSSNISPSDGKFPITYKSSLNSVFGSGNQPNSTNRPPVKRTIADVDNGGSQTEPISFKKRSSYADKVKGAKQSPPNVDSHNHFPILLGTSKFKPSKDDQEYVSNNPRPPKGVGVIGGRRPNSQTGAK